MAIAVAMMIGGAVVNALAFRGGGGGNFLFSKLGKSNNAERERGITKQLNN